MRLYKGLLRPVLESSCVVWDGASENEKVKLEKVHRAALLAATGAHQRATTKELEVYCNVESLQERRDYLSSSYFNRIQRLDQNQHPIAKALQEWKAKGCPHLVPRASFFVRVVALCRCLNRFSNFTDGGQSFLERMPSLTDNQMNKRPRRFIDKQKAKIAHVNMINRLLPSQDIVIYTDGSACPNPGHIGLGVSMKVGIRTQVYGESIGIGSNITAELCAIDSAIKKCCNLQVIHQFSRIFIFSDCQNAIDLSIGRVKPTSSFDVVKSIQENLATLRSKISVDILWVPAHVGVPGNEAANIAAKEAAKSVIPKFPQPGQPLIPYSTSKALILAALKHRRQLEWFKIVAERSNTEHLSRLRVDISKSNAFFFGTRSQQVLLSRLRFGTSCLNVSLSKRSNNVNETCACGQRETVKHFLLFCERYETFRFDMLRKIRAVWPGVINEDLLLGGSGVSLENHQWQVVVEAVATYVKKTRRGI